MMKMTEVLNWLMENKGTDFSIRFIKRTTNELREMNCRFGPSLDEQGNPIELVNEPKDFARHGLVCVYDTDKMVYRSFPLNGLMEIKIKDQWHKIENDLIFNPIR